MQPVIDDPSQRWWSNHPPAILVTPMETYRILYIEDDDEQREALTGKLAALGHEVRAASGGQEGLAQLERAEAPFDAVLCDLNMPRMTGFEVMEQALPRHRDLPFIILTAHGSIDLGIQAIKRGAYHFVTKPFSLDEIELHLRLAVDHTRTQRRLERSEQRLALLMETVPDIIYSLDQQGNFLSVSKSGEQLLGYTVREMLGTSVFALVHPDDRGRVLEGLEQSVREHDDAINTIEFRMVNKGGEPRDYEVSRRLVFDGERVVRNDGIARDITERKRLDADLAAQTEAVRRANAELRAIFDTTNAAIVMVGSDDTITAANRQVGAFFGLDREALEGTPFSDFVEQVRDHFEDSERFGALVQQLTAQPDRGQMDGVDHFVVFERMLRTSRPEERYLACFCPPVVGAQDEELGRAWIFSDVTKLKEADEQLHTIVEVSPVPLIITRISDGTILFANEHLGDLVGLPYKEMVGRKSPDFYHDPNQRAEVLLHLQRDGELKNFECRFRRQGGGSFWAILSLVTAEIDNEPVIIGGVVDIDARKRIEEDLRWERNFVSAVLDTAGALVLVLDRGGRVVRFNEACRRSSGYTLEEARGRPFWELFLLPEEVEEVRAIFSSLKAGEFPNSHENHWLTKTGEQRVVSWSNTALTDDSGEVEYVIATGIDITERRLAEADLVQANLELREKQMQLMQSEKMASLGMLVAGIAHEINTPIGAVNSMHNTLVRSTQKLKQTLEKDFPEAFAGNKRLKTILRAIDDANQVIESGTSRVTTIVRRLKSFARLDEAELKTVDIHEGLEDTLSIIHHELKHKVKVVRRYGELPEVPCYPGPLNQVFLNLFINANQAIADTGEMTVSTSADEANLFIEIRDSGGGIPAEIVKRIFDPGFTTKGVGVGTGLGLSICYQIMQDHHGEIRVESAEGRGSAFTVVLPRNLDELKGIKL
jgi:PAS domain S-box-containing protein